MKIIKLSSENVKRIKAVEITPQGNMIVIGGRNGAGKSSVIDSIAYALAGKSSIPSQPVRQGEDAAKIVVELDDLTVTRTFTAGGKSDLTITSSDGAKYPSPQAMLDKLVGRLTFDPLAFSRMDGKKQLETLRELVGIDFADQDRKRAGLYDQRTQVNRRLKELEASLSLTEHYDDVPDALVATSELLNEMDAATNRNEANRLEHQTFAAINAEILECQSEMNIARLNITGLEKALGVLNDMFADANDRLGQQSTIVEKLLDVDLQPIRKRILNADEENSRVRANLEYVKLKDTIVVERRKSTKLSADIDGIHYGIQMAIKDASFPIPGLMFDSDGVRYNNLPFSQASSAEQLRVSVAMGLAMNPKLRVLLIKDGSLLDPDSLRMIGDMAAKADAQIWIETVSQGGEVSVVIEDGAVKATAPAGELAEAYEK